MSAQDHHASAPVDPHGAHEHEEAAEETLAHDEAPTPLWLPVLGAGLFFIAFVLIAAF